MASLVWDSVGDRTFESGLDRGVLYLQDGSGVVWNGLISVTENPNTEVEPVYFDGKKIYDTVTTGDYSATLAAFTYPEEFEQFDGILSIANGANLRNQRLNRFGLSYRVRIGDDIRTISGYKIHVLYNLLAVVAGMEFKTISANIEAVTFEWNITAVPIDIPDYEPTAHFILDTSRAPAGLIAAVEGHLYGSDTSDPNLPPLSYFVNLAKQDW